MAQPTDPRVFYGYLYAHKQPTKLLDALLRGIANYISNSIGDKDDKTLSPAKLAGFYKAVGGNYDSLFVDVPHYNISWIYASIGCQHTLQPTADDFKQPSIPALTAQGFVRWQSIEILLGPEEHVPFIQYAVNNFDIKNPDTGESFPKEIPAEAFPLEPDREIVKWHSTCGEKLRQRATPPEERDERSQPNLSSLPKVQTGYAHVRPAHSARGHSNAKDYFDPRAKPIPYQHVSGTRPVRPGLSTSPAHRDHQFLAPEGGHSPRSTRSRRRSFPEASSPIGSPQAGPPPEPPTADHGRRHSHPRHARRGSCSSDASSEGDEPPSPRSRTRESGSGGPRSYQGDVPPIRFAYAAPPAVPPAPDSRPRTREGRERERADSAQRMNYPIPIDLSGKLSAPFLLGRKDHERAPRTSSRSGKVGWKDLSGIPSNLHQSSKSSEDDRERERGPSLSRRDERERGHSASRRQSRDERDSGPSVSRRQSRDERERGHSSSRRQSREERDSGPSVSRRQSRDERDSGSSDHKRRERARERDKDQVRPPRSRPSSHDDGSSRRDRERERDVDGRAFRDRERRQPSPRGEGRYYSSAR